MGNLYYQNLVSVIIPAFNQQQFINKTVQSVLEQSYANIEIIIVDDCSTDETYKLLESSYENIKILRHKVNQGLSATRNTGIKAAFGQYIMFLDSDDILHKDCINNLISYFATHKTQSLVYCWADMIDEAGKKLPETCCYKKEGGILDDLIISNQFPIHSFLIDRISLDSIGYFDTNLKAAEDWDLWIRFAKKNYQFGCIPEKLVSYRIHSQSMRTLPTHMTVNLQRTVDKIYNSDTFPKTIKEKKPQAYHQIYLLSAGAFASVGEWTQAVNFFHRSNFTSFFEAAPQRVVGDFIKYFTPLGYRCPEGISLSIDRILLLQNEFLEKYFESFPNKRLEREFRTKLSLYLGILLYCERNIIKAREQLFYAFSVNPLLILDGLFLRTFVKAFLPKGFIYLMDSIKKDARHAK